jgi:outer membrane protein TolC
MKTRVPIGLLSLCACACSLHAQANYAFRMLSLEDAAVLDLKQNSDVADAESRMAEVDAWLRAAQGACRLTVKARGTCDYCSEGQRLLAATRNGEAGVFGEQIFGAEPVATLPLYIGGRVTVETETAVWTRRAAAEQFVRTRESLVFQVIGHFYDLLAHEKVLRSLETALRAMGEQELTGQSMVAAEKAARVDLLRAYVRRAALYERQIREGSIRTALQYAWAALRRSARERLRRLERQIRSQVESARTDTAAARERVRATEKSVGQAEESFRIVKEKYERAVEHGRNMVSPWCASGGARLRPDRADGAQVGAAF